MASRIEVERCHGCRMGNEDTLERSLTVRQPSLLGILRGGKERVLGDLVMCFVETNRRGLDTLVVHESVSLEEVSRIYDQCPGRDGSETIEDALVACPAMNTVSNLVLKRTSAY